MLMTVGILHMWLDSIILKVCKDVTFVELHRISKVRLVRLAPYELKPNRETYNPNLLSNLKYLHNLGNFLTYKITEPNLSFDVNLDMYIHLVPDIHFRTDF
jgi:hypothetical protein